MFFLSRLEILFHLWDHHTILVPWSTDRTDSNTHIKLTFGSVLVHYLMFVICRNPLRKRVSAFLQEHSDAFMNTCETQQTEFCFSQWDRSRVRVPLLFTLLASSGHEVNSSGWCQLYLTAATSLQYLNLWISTSADMKHSWEWLFLCMWT